MCTEFRMQPNAHAKTGKCDPLFADLVTIALTSEALIYRRAWYVSAPFTHHTAELPHDAQPIGLIELLWILYLDQKWPQPYESGQPVMISIVQTYLDSRPFGSAEHNIFKSRYTTLRENMHVGP